MQEKPWLGNQTANRGVKQASKRGIWSLRLHSVEFYDIWVKIYLVVFRQCIIDEGEWRAYVLEKQTIDEYAQTLHVESKVKKHYYKYISKTGNEKGETNEGSIEQFSLILSNQGPGFYQNYY